MSQSTLLSELPLAIPLANSVTHFVVICILLIAALQLLSPDKPLGAKLTKLFGLSFALFDNLNGSTLHIWSITAIQFNVCTKKSNAFLYSLHNSRRQSVQ